MLRCVRSIALAMVAGLACSDGPSAQSAALSAQEELSACPSPGCSCSELSPTKECLHSHGQRYR